MFRFSQSDVGFIGLVSSLTTPTSPVSGMTLWLDANDSTTITLSGSNVTNWNDKSGNGNDFTSSSTVTIGDIGGKDAISFPTFNGNLLTSLSVLSDVITASAYTIFCVFETSNIDAGPGGLFSDTGGFLVLEVGDAASPDANILNVDGGLDTASVATGANTSTGVVVVAQHTGGNIRIALGSDTWAQTTASGDTSTLSNKLQVGRGQGGTPWFHGRIGEIIIYDKASSDSEISSNITYLTNKWSL